MTISSIGNAAITGLPDPRRNIRELQGCLEEPNGDGGSYARIFTPIFNITTGAGWVQGAKKLSNPTHFRVGNGGQEANGTDGAPTGMGRGRRYLPLDEILPPLADHMVDDIGEELDEDGETRHPNPRHFSTTKTGFQQFARQLQTRIIRQL